MKPFALLVAALVVGTALVALSPTVDARQVCHRLRGDPTCPGFVCAWNHLESSWTCVLQPIYCVTDPCWPYLP